MLLRITQMLVGRRASGLVQVAKWRSTAYDVLLAVVL
jgi:hypothetical protein